MHGHLNVKQNRASRVNKSLAPITDTHTVKYKIRATFRNMGQNMYTRRALWSIREKWVVIKLYNSTLPSNVS